MVPPLVLMLPLLMLQASGCRLSEFECLNGRCVPSGRYCDGNDDCGDLSDEPTACTNCNRTFYAEANVKSPLRMSTPYQRPLPFVCSMTFVAAGGQYGDLVQLTFLSFQIGALEMDNDSNPACLKGYLQIVEPPALTSALLSQQTRGFSQILSALKEPSEQLSSLFSRGGADPHFGRLCGDMIGKSATFYTQGNNVTIRVVIPGKAALHPFSFSVYLTYKYLPRDASAMPGIHQAQPPPLTEQHPRTSTSTASSVGRNGNHYRETHRHPLFGNDNHYYYGNKLTNTYCDRVLVNCDRKRCALRSPNFPGFYLRNITCHYWIRQEQVPHGRHANIVLRQSNEYKISLYTGRSSPLSYPHVSLTEECHSDVIRVFDGPSTSSPLLIEFCGAGTLTEVVSSSAEILVQLYSAPSQVMHNSYAEIEVGVRFTEVDDYRLTSTADGGRCDFRVDGRNRRSGILYSPRHTIPRNTTCRFRLRGADSHDRVWVYFLSYYVEDRHPWSRRETCEVGRLEIYESQSRRGEAPTSSRRRRSLGERQADRRSESEETSDVGRPEEMDGRTIPSRHRRGIYEHGALSPRPVYRTKRRIPEKDRDWKADTIRLPFERPQIRESGTVPSRSQKRKKIRDAPGTNSSRCPRKRDAAALLVTGEIDEETGERLLVHEGWSREEEEEGGPPSYRFCEKTFPKVCARAADNPPDYVPVRPCRVPGESYLSRGASLLIRHNAYTTPELPTWSSSFTLRYEFVDTRQHGAPGAGGEPCDRRFDSRTSDRFGSVDSPRNVFLFGRGGRRDLSCRYEFFAEPGERIVLKFTDVRLRRDGTGCRHHYDPTVQRHTCRYVAAGRSEEELHRATLTVEERTPDGSGQFASPLACFCDFRSEPTRPLVVESVTNRVTVLFEVTGMTPLDDFEDFGFEAVYEFLPITLCGASIRKRNGSSEGQVIFRVPSIVEARSMPLRCRWLLEAAPRKYLYLRFRGTDGGTEECPHRNNKIIIYSSLPTVAPISVVCLGGGASGGSPASIAGAESAAASGSGGDVTTDGSPSDREVDVFSNHWYNESADPQVLRDHVYIEVLAVHADTVRFEWIEVTKPYRGRTRPVSGREGGPCPFECPELNACIGAELWCDGRRHCPSGYDEAPAHCERFPTPYVVAGASAGAVILLVILALVTMRCRRRGEFKESRPVPTEDFPMDSPHV